MTVSFILKAQNLSALESKVQSGWTGPYLTTAQFAQQYGQTPQVVSELAVVPRPATGSPRPPTPTTST